MVRSLTPAGGADMNYFAGLDASLEWTSACVVDADGGIVREAKVVSEPAALAAFFTGLDFGLTRICLEAGPLSQWLHDGLAEAGLPVVCAETRQLKAVLSATVNKNDRDDARGIAQLVRANLIRPVHVKTVPSQEKRMLLANRRFMPKQLCGAESDIRGTLRNFGLKVGKVTRRGLEARVPGLVAERPALALLVKPMLRARAALLAQYVRLHRMMLEAVRADPVCRRLMTVPGAGPVTALIFRASVDVPSRFARSRWAALRACASQMAIRRGRPNGKNLQVRGRDDARGALRSRQRLARAHERWSWLKACAMGVAKRRGKARAKVALARRLGVIMPRMWMDGGGFRW